MGEETGYNRITLKGRLAGSARFVSFGVQGALGIIKAWIGCQDPALTCKIQKLPVCDRTTYKEIGTWSFAVE
jgi:hypothetical protein